MNKPFYEETEKDRSDLVKFMIYLEHFGKKLNYLEARALHKASQQKEEYQNQLNQIVNETMTVGELNWCRAEDLSFTAKHIVQSLKNIEKISARLMYHYDEHITLES